MKIVVLDGYTENPGDLSWDGFRQFGEVIVYDRTPKELILSRMDGAEVVFTNKVVITRKIIEASPALRFIGTLSTGYNTVDLEAADERQIPVSNIPSYSTQAVAQLTMALLLEICHHVGHIQLRLWLENGAVVLIFVFGVIHQWSLLERQWESLDMEILDRQLHVWQLRLV